MAALGLFAKRLLDQGKYIELYATLLAEDGFLRESDWESICGCNVLWHPMPAGPPRVAVRLGSGARGLSTKTGPDQGVVLNGHFLRWWAVFLTDQTNEKEKLVPIDQVAYRKEWNKTWLELK